MIDLCPVGALTSKPFRYTARPWELTRHAGVSPHDGLGANLLVQVKKDRVMRVLPRDNEAVNECWLADRDRFSYQALYAEDRLATPMVRTQQGWAEVDWETALEYVANGLREVVKAHGGEAVGALATPHSTLEELYLLQKLMRGLGSDNVDHRLRQADFSVDALRVGIPWLGQAIAEIERADAILLVGSNIRKEQPLLAHRVRQAVKRGARLSVINPFDEDMLCRIASRSIVPPPLLVDSLARVVRAAAAIKGVEVSPLAAACGAVEDTQAEAMAADLCRSERGSILLGSLAQHHPQAGLLHGLAAELARITGARLGFPAEAANSVGAYLAQAVPKGNGLHAAAMVAEPRRAYVLLNVEAELDSYDPQATLRALNQAELVVALSPFRHAAMEYAHVLLPVAPFAETAGTYVNMEGRVQSFAAAVKPLAQARPAWKVLRVLGNLLGLAGFEQTSAEEVRREALPETEEDLRARLDNGLRMPPSASGPLPAASLWRIGEVPIYQLDALTRRAVSLQATPDASPPRARMHPAVLAELGIIDGEMVVLRQGEGRAVLPAVADARIPPGCVHVAAGHPLTAGLGGMFDALIVERA
jgi:NADH-quinone oxidoreductase subunit G